MSSVPPPNALVVSSNGDTIGFLTHQSGRLTFQYSLHWLEKDGAFPIAPCFPFSDAFFTDSDEYPRVSWFFDNLLPEETERQLFSQLVEAAPDDSWAMLRHGGAETAGGLTLLPAESQLAKPKLVPLTESSLEARIRDNKEASMQSGAPKLISLAGAQAKLAVNVIGDAFFEPAGVHLSTHVLKPDSKANYYPHTAINELYCMRLAAAVGIKVPRVALHRIPAPVFAVERFDRVHFDGQWMARHVIDGTQMLGLGSQHKYKMMTGHMLKLCCELCTDPTATGQAIFDWAVFNVLVGNSDAHLKNISFFADHDGITLAPFYDLLSTACYATPDNFPFAPHWPSVTLSMPIGKSTRYEEITRKDFLEFGSALGIPPSQAEFQLDSMVLGVRRHAERVFEKTSATASERRLLNLIRHLPIREMSHKLGQPYER